MGVSPNTRPTSPATPTAAPAAVRRGMAALDEAPKGAPHRLGPRPDELSLRPAPAPEAPEGFRDHLRGALALNHERRDVYDRLSGGKSRSLSNTLIALERLSLPAAMLMDAWAKPYQERGIPLMHADFVSMTQVRSPFAPPRYRGVASDSEVETVKGWLSDFRKGLGDHLDRADFTALAGEAHDLLERLEATERRTGSHFAMSKHVVESLGLAALNAADYAARTQGETLRLSRTFIRLQSLALLTAVSLDRRAQELHRQGIGILVNDIPDIPFAARWQAKQATEPRLAQ